MSDHESTGSDAGAGTPDLRALGRLVEARRLGMGLRPGELAVRARLRHDAPSGGSELRKLELHGVAGLVTIVRVLEALGIDDATVLRACGLDLAAMRVRWEAWADVQDPVSVSVRLLPAVWMRAAPPAGTDPEGILAWATGHPQWRHCVRCIRWSRRHCTYLRPDGTSYEVHASFPEDCPEPWMRLA